jgi:hypothetical protein
MNEKVWAPRGDYLDHCVAAGVTFCALVGASLSMTLLVSLAARLVASWF